MLTPEEEEAQREWEAWMEEQERRRMEDLERVYWDERWHRENGGN
jgi:hypothetical protein